MTAGIYGPRLRPTISEAERLRRKREKQAIDCDPRNKCEEPGCGNTRKHDGRFCGLHVPRDPCDAAQDLEDWLDEVISDSIDMDWTSRDAALLIMSRLEQAGALQDVLAAVKDKL